MSNSSLSSISKISSTQLEIYVCSYITISISVLFICKFGQNLYQQLTKSLSLIHPNHIIPCKVYMYIDNLLSIMLAILPIMLALCSMLVLPQYAQNDACIIGSCLTSIANITQPPIHAYNKKTMVQQLFYCIITYLVQRCSY